MGLLTELLLESEQNVDFCKTPVGEDPNVGLFVVLLSTSPKGPPKEFPHEIGIQVFTFFTGWTVSSVCIERSNSRDSLRGESGVLSWAVLCVEEGDDDAIGIDIESCVQSGFSSSGQELWFWFPGCLSWLLLKSKYDDP